MFASMLLTQTLTVFKYWILLHLDVLVVICLKENKVPVGFFNLDMLDDVIVLHRICCGDFSLSAMRIAHLSRPNSILMSWLKVQIGLRKDSSSLVVLA